MDEAAINSVLKMEMDRIHSSLNKITAVLNSTKSNNMRIRNEVTESMQNSMGLWNSMMMSLGSKAQPSFLQSMNSAAASSPSPFASFSSQVSVKEDARDLLEKYSELLLETMRKKINS